MKPLRIKGGIIAVLLHMSGILIMYSFLSLSILGIREEIKFFSFWFLGLYQFVYMIPLIIYYRKKGFTNHLSSIYSLTIIPFVVSIIVLIIAAILGFLVGSG